MAEKRKRDNDETEYLSPQVTRAVNTIHLRAENNLGRCGIVGTKDDPQLTTDPSLVTCPRCRGRKGLRG